MDGLVDLGLELKYSLDLLPLQTDLEEILRE
jgi:hypothetical protein